MQGGSGDPIRLCGVVTREADLQDVDQTFEGDNTVMMQQVAKALLDGKNGKNGASQPPRIADAALQDHEALSLLLAYRSSRHDCALMPLPRLAEVGAWRGRKGRSPVC